MNETGIVDVINLLRDIKRKRVKLTLTSPNDVVYIRYTTDNGWKIVVFDDVGYWKYLHEVEAPDGTLFDYDDLYDYDIRALMHRLEPEGSELNEIWYVNRWDWNRERGEPPCSN